jgi:hypothetical protein
MLSFDRCFLIYVVTVLGETFEYLPQVGSSVYSLGTKVTSTGQLLRLSEQTDDSEYVLLVPEAVSEILLDLLQQAVASLTSVSR